MPNWGNVLHAEEENNIKDLSPFLDSTISGDATAFEKLKASGHSQVQFQK